MKHGLISPTTWPSMPAPMDSEDDGEAWIWDDYVLVLQKNPTNCETVLARVRANLSSKQPPAAKAPLPIEYPYALVAYYKKHKNPHGPSSQIILCVAIECVDYSALPREMHDLARSQGETLPTGKGPLMIGMFKADGRSNLGLFEGFLTRDSAREKLFWIAGEQLQPNGSPQRIGTIDAIHGHPETGWTRSGDSEELVLPKAPPKPPAHRVQEKPPAENSKTTPLPSVQKKPYPPAVPANQPLPSPFFPPSGVEQAGPVAAHPVAEKQNGKPGKGNIVPWAIAGILTIIIIFLLVRPPQKAVEVEEINEIEGRAQENNIQGELDEARHLAESRQTRINKLQDMVEQLHALMKSDGAKAQSKLDEMTRRANSEGENASKYIAEIEVLKKQLELAAAPHPTMPLKAATVEPTPPLPTGRPYRINNLSPGDTLNMRGGPGSQHPVVTQLRTGARIIVTGDAVSNGPDLWLPCSVESLSTYDPVNGIYRPVMENGWINSMFAEEIPSP